MRDSPRVTIVEGDALELDWHALAGPRFLVAGNIPYNITSPLIDKALDAAATGAHRLPGAEGGGGPGDAPTAGEPAYGALSVGVQSVARAERLFTVPAGAFHPRPKVDSAVLRLTPLAEPLVEPAEQAELPPARGRAVRLPSEAAARGLRELTGWDAGAGRASARPRRRSPRRPGPRCCRPRRSPRCCARSLTGGGRHGSFVKCFTKMPAMRKVAESTVRRLSLYLRFLEEFEGQGIETVSSGALASRGSTTSAQVRKDLSFFGSFGKRGLGYPVPELADQLREILGLKQRYQVGMIGAGKIGSALVQYRGFRQRGFDIMAIFDSDPSKIGRQWNGLTIQDIETLETEFAKRPMDMAVLVTPADAAQPVTDRLVALGDQGHSQLRAGAAGRAGRRGRQDRQPRPRARNAQLRAGQPLTYSLTTLVSSW